MSAELSKMQFVAMGLIHDANLFTAADLAHISFVKVVVRPTDAGENALIAVCAVYFNKWSHTDQQPIAHEDTVPAEIWVTFDQDEERRLTGRVEVGFWREKPALIRQLDYLRGWR